MGAAARQGFVFGMGLVLGVVAGGSLLAGYKEGGMQRAAAAPAAAAPAAAAVQAEPFCAFDPVLAAKAGIDKFSVPMDGAGHDAADVPAYLAVGEDVARQGRARDAEIAFITACRIAGRVKGADSVEMADAKYGLAQHYADAAGKDLAGPARAAILKRAETLMSDSVTAFGAKLGIADEKTALAAGGLSRLQAALHESEVPSGVPRVLLAERSSPDYGVAMVNTAALGAAAERSVPRATAPTPGETDASAEPSPTPTPTSAPTPEPAPAPAAVAAAAPKPANTPVCIGGDCPTQERLVREREIEREPAPAIQASRKLTMPAPSLPPAPPPEAISQATGSATGSPAQPDAP